MAGVASSHRTTVPLELTRVGGASGTYDTPTSTTVVPPHELEKKKIVREINNNGEL